MGVFTLMWLKSVSEEFLTLHLEMGAEATILLVTVPQYEGWHPGQVSLPCVLQLHPLSFPKHSECV